MEYMPLFKKEPLPSHQQPASEPVEVDPAQRIAAPSLQLKAADLPLQLQSEEEEEELMMKKSPFQLKEGNSAQPTLSGGGGQPLPENVRGQMEQTFSADFSDVRIHANSEAAPSVGARAFTSGNSIHFGPGEFSPSNSAGQELLGHELTHVVQQREGRVQQTGSVNGLPLNDDIGLENEADQMGKVAAQQKKRD